MNQHPTPPIETPAAPWWRHGHVWLVIAGPAAVVVAGVATLAIALRVPDPVVDENYYQHGLELNRTLRAGHAAAAPALEGRNHAATPAEDWPSR